MGCWCWIYYSFFFCVCVFVCVNICVCVWLLLHFCVTKRRIEIATNFCWCWRGNGFRQQKMKAIGVSLLEKNYASSKWSRGGGGQSIFWIPFIVIFFLYSFHLILSYWLCKLENCYPVLELLNFIVFKHLFSKLSLKKAKVTKKSK